MIDKQCYIFEDLLPLYNENLLSSETTEWMKYHMSQCNECKDLYELSKEQIIKSPIEATQDVDVMFKKINRKLSLYQIIFVILSFYFAINTSLINESFGFVLWYAILGCVIYVFYKDMKIVFLLSFLPIFIWSFGENVISFFKSNYVDISFWGFLLENLMGSFMISLIHFLFALIGGIAGLCILKIKER